MRIGIFGGTFDPPHLGHLGVARSALDSGAVDELWVVPCLAHRLGKSPAPFELRLAMCRLLFEDTPRILVSDIERRLERPGHTFDLVLAIRRENPGATLSLVAGADIYHERDQWHRYDEIVAAAPPLYVDRRGVPPAPPPTLPAPPDISSSEIREAVARGERPVDRVPRRVYELIRAHGLYREA